MHLTLIVTIDPVKKLSLLNVLIHSLNLQTIKTFDVVFYNQIPLEESEVFAQLEVSPQFEYRWFGIEKEDLLGNYPIWDLYGLHAFLLEHGLVGDYCMALHMEEFLDVDYVEKVTGVLERHRFDILLGNLRRTTKEYSELGLILQTSSASAFDAYLNEASVKTAPHWSARTYPSRWARMKADLQRWLTRPGAAPHGIQLRPTQEGYTRFKEYNAEDVFLMKREFAVRHNWFLSGHRLCFEDVHICQIPGVCELGSVLTAMTDFPVYFNQSRVHHLRHEKLYYQLVDPEFTARLLEYQTDNPVLNALKTAIRKYRSGDMTLWEAVQYTRNNPDGTGTQSLNWKYHMMHLRDARRR